MTRRVGSPLKIIALVLVHLGYGCVVHGQTEQRSDDVEFFEARIRPALVRYCYECHSSASAEAKGGLLLDFRDGPRNGGESGAAVVPGNPQDSLLIEALKFGSFEMPPSGRLPDGVIADFETWIRNGAVDPRVNAPSAAESAEESWKSQLTERSRWWSLQPPRKITPPAIKTGGRPAVAVDRFVWSALKQAGLTSAKPANARVLLRRLSFVLTGLPPTPDQVETFPRAFTMDADLAIAGLVDALLDSPHFGERFARHWMDVIRYTDTYGYEWDIPAKGSWEYRDYLIRAFNNDVGFDQLIREQIAGDLLTNPRIDAVEGINESMIGPMFYHLGEHRHGSSLAFNGIHQEMINNKIDAFSKAFLGMTVACARCHDHKLDAISQADYYALAGMFMTPRWTARPIDVPGKYDAEATELKQLREQIRTRLAGLWTSGSGPLTSEASLQAWARDNRSSMDATTIEDVAWPIRQIYDESYTGEVWRKLADQWRAEREARRNANAAAFTELTDFSEPVFPDAWVAEGEGLRHGHVADGTPLVSLDGETLISSFLMRGFHTHALSSKLPGALRLPAPEHFPSSIVSLRLEGGEWAGRRAIPQNAFLNEGPVFFDPSAAPAWTPVAATALTNGVTRVLTEITTASLNANFPPRTGVARAGSTMLPDKDEGQNKRSWFSVTGIVAHDAAGTPRDTLNAFATLYDDNDAAELTPPVSADEAWRQLRNWLTGTVSRWADGLTQPGDVRILNWLLAEGLLQNDSKTAPQIAALVSRYREVESGIAFARSANSMDERKIEPVDYRINVRGNVDEEGAVVRRNFLEIFAGKHAVGSASDSGRAELARYLSSDANPQTARVFVNRVWQWVFGTGIVATPNDFGKLGDRPSHAELLDWLAIRFMAEGWSTKKLVRQLVLSQTFRQSGRVSAAGSERDPENRLLHHYPTRRLEAEAIRDSLLTVSGRLDPRLYGPPINPPRPSEDAAKRLFSGPLDSHGRRSLYIEMSIMEPPRFLAGFNLPDLKLPTGSRDVTNVPAQALIMLNNPLVVQLADQWATQLIEDGSVAIEQRVRRMFLHALGRPPSNHEVKRWAAAVSDFAQSNDLITDKAAWSELAHALFNTKEFIYYR
ncbi:MAG: PSD1 and planctomycete cytochrome C domain-containing protein [Fuerstiella sp.]|nr:PSD1 and planctomycete cytochrome C domain-containing protein [Fuerstiella sp.]